MPQYYPAFLDLRDKQVVLIGGGRETENKIPSLLECGARVTVIAPALACGPHMRCKAPQCATACEAGERTRVLAEEGKITWLARDYEEGDLADAWVAVVGSEDRELNHRAANEARARRVLVNTVDDLPYCDFIAPAIVRRGEMALAISTGGGSPAMARYARQELQRLIPAEWGQLLEALSDARLELRHRGVRPNPERWQECIDGELLALLRSGAQEEATARLVTMLVEHPQPVGAKREG